MLPFKLFFILSLAPSIYAAQLFSYGLERGDQKILFSRDPSAIALDVPIVYFEDNQNELFIGPNGIVYFSQPRDHHEVFDLQDTSMSAIAVFYVPTDGGVVYYRSTSTDHEVLNDLTERIRKNFPHRESTEFVAVHAVIITWDGMYTPDSSKGSNQFQLALVTDGISSYALFIYNHLEWASSDGRFAQAGIYASDGRRQPMVNSGTAGIQDLTRLSNNQREGTFLFRISGASPEDPKASLSSDDDYSYSDYEGEYEDPESQKRQPPAQNVDCPPDPYRHRCPSHCRLLTDDRGCTMCVCTQPPEREQPEEAHGENDINHDMNNPSVEQERVPQAREDDRDRDGYRYEHAAPGVGESDREREEDEREEHEGEPQAGVYSSREEAPQPGETSNHVPSQEEHRNGENRFDERTDEREHPVYSADSSNPLTCAAARETSEPCHASAECVDYSPGYCCVCNSGYIGNGEDCVKAEEAQRVNGIFEGVINGEEIRNTELHTFVSDGRAYTAISALPAHLGRSLLLLSPIGSAMGWLFAKVESPTSYNGFELTGGIFNRTINVHIGDRSAVTIKQEFSGRDSYRYFKVQVFITGTLPQLSSDVEVVYPDHEDEYRREGPGFVRSYTTQNVIIKENGAERSIKLTIDQQIHYKECPYRTFDKDAVVVIRVSRPHVVYDAEEQITRYASANVATSSRSRTFSEEAQVDEPARQAPSHPDVAQHHRQRADQPDHDQQVRHPHRKELADSSRQYGYAPSNTEPDRAPQAPLQQFAKYEKGEYPQYPAQSEAQHQQHPQDFDARSQPQQQQQQQGVGGACKRENPCESGFHMCTLPNMFCVPVEGSYRCQCEKGYEAAIDMTVGLGWKCNDLDECQRGHICDRNADCINTVGSFECRCKRGYVGDGFACQRVEDEPQTQVSSAGAAGGCTTHQQCHQWGECVFGRQGQPGYCRCRGYYVGDGIHTCGPPDTYPGQQAGQPAVDVNVPEENTGRLCGGYTCDPNADCMPAPRGGDECVCRSGFYGNGVRCEPHPGHGRVEEPAAPGVEEERRAQPVPSVGGCTSHQECHQWGECVFGQHGQSGYCKCRGYYVGDGVHHCGPPEQPPAPTPQVPQEAERLCGGYACDPNADCMPSSRGGEECVCRSGYYGNGVRCEPEPQRPPQYPQQALPTHPPVIVGTLCRAHSECGEHGNCVYSNEAGYYKCVCVPPYTGDGVTCVLREGVEVGPRVVTCDVENNCDANADCVFEKGSHGEGYHRCRCRPGFTGSGIRCTMTSLESLPEDSEHAQCDREFNCGTNSDCVHDEEQNRYVCRCADGFDGDGYTCTPIQRRPVPPQVATGPTCRDSSECHSNAHCVIKDGTHEYVCECLPGYRGDGVSDCRPAEECNPVEAQSCGANAECVYGQAERAYVCKCASGYTGDGRTCVPFVPAEGGGCDVDPTICHSKAECVYSAAEGKHICVCRTGTVGDGYTDCRIPNECNPESAYACASNADCVYGSAEGTNVCKCKPGFVGDGRTCTMEARRSCDQEPLLCHANAYCQFSHSEDRYLCMCKTGFQGDGYTDCQPQETPRCEKCSANARCVERESGAWVCECNPGFQGNGHVCAPFTSCLDDRAICSANAECVPGEHGYYVCNCHYGYHGDGRVCTPDTESAREEALLIGRGMTVIQRSTNPDLPGKQLVVIPHQIVVGVDFDCLDEKIVWSDISGHSIRVASLNGTNEKKYYEALLKSPEGVAVDWSSRNIYYTDSTKDEIGVLTMDGRYQKVLIKEGLVNPRALAIDHRNRHLYYSDWHREHPLIGRVELNGDNNVAFVTNDIYLPNGLAVLEERRELCWVDAGMQRLSCITLDGRSRRVVYAPLEYPFGLTVFNEQRFYWTDWKDHRIHSVSVYGDGYTSFPPTIGGSGRLYGLVAIPPRCKGTPSACALNNGGCAHMCLAGSNRVTCACPDNVPDLDGC